MTIPIEIIALWPPFAHGPYGSLASTARTPHVDGHERKTPPAPLGSRNTPAKPRSDAGEIDAFVRQARAMATPGGKGSGRLILALDATMSRQPTWDLACKLQAEMFDAVGKAGSLNVQLVYFRGFGECRASKFVSDTTALKDLMVENRLPRRPYADRQGSLTCLEGNGDGESECRRLHRRRDGGGDR